MILALLMFVSVYPVIGIWLYVRFSKLHIKLPVFLTALIGGVASAIIAVLLQSFIAVLPFNAGKFSDMGLLLFDIFVRIAFTEELSRFLVLLLLFKLIPKIFNLALDARLTTVCGITAGLMFGSLETALISTTNAQITIVRLFSAAPLHGACGARCAMAAFKLKDNPRNTRHFLGAIILHGFYDTMLPRGGIFAFFAIIFAVLALVHALWPREAENG